jgi:hypothetical protein
MVIRTTGRRPLISTSKDYTLTSSLVRDLKKLTALDLSFQSEQRWDLEQKSKYISSLILGMAPSKVIICNISECLKNSQPDSWDFIYFNNWKQKGFENISIDGNNRTITIDEYMSGKVSILHGDYQMPNGQIVVIDKNNDTWIKHPTVFRKYIEENIFLTITEYTNAYRQDLTNLFICINDGFTLNAQELRNAILVPYAEWVRKMTSLTYNDMLVRVFPTIKQKVRRVIDDFIVSMSIFTTYNTKKSIQGVEKNLAYEDDSTVSQKVQLERAEKLIKSFASFVKKNCGEEMKNHSTLFNLFMLHTYLFDNEYVVKDDGSFYKWFMSSENKRIADTKSIMTTSGGESRTYESCNSTMSSPELTARYNYLIKDLSLVIDVYAEKKDEIRLFSPQERYKLWERQKGTCPQTGKIIPEFEINDDTKWHADHIMPYSKGGKTTLENGQLIDKLSNLQKSNKLSVIR